MRGRKGIKWERKILKMSDKLAAYIAEHVNEEYQKKYHNHRNGTFPRITKQMILRAIDSYEAIEKRINERS